MSNQPSLLLGSSPNHERGSSLFRRDFISVASSIANAQFGLVSHRQLVDGGLDRSTIYRYLSDGYLVQIHRGVYSVGHDVLTPKGRWLAAVLASGEGACLSHRSAAALWGLAPPCLPVEVVRQSGGMPPTKVLVHRTRFLPPEEVTYVEGIRVTIAERTLVDYAGVVSPRMLEDAYSVARRRNIAETRAIFRVIDLAPNRKGAGVLRKLVAQYSRTLGWTRSELETRFLGFIHEFDLPMPEVDIPLGAKVVDFLWRDQKLIGEVDSVEYHLDRFTQDRNRDIDHLALGFRTIRITDWMIENEAEDLARRLRIIIGPDG